ncbi:MAG: hypothetical protein IJD66_00805 [Methanocorpusculum sp.]|nr:hypothetical protein [Methanocorpusculum sp.]
MTKERQTQIMKPLKVLSLVLLALLLLVPAASAETYTLIDEDLVFGGGSGGSIVNPSKYLYRSVSYTADESFVLGDFFPFSQTFGSDQLGWYVDFDNPGVLLNGVVQSQFTSDSPDSPIVNSGDKYHVITLGLFQSGFTGTASDWSSYVSYIESYLVSLSVSCPDSYVLCSGIQGSTSICNIYVYPYPEPSLSEIQHVTVTYSDESERYTVTLERNGVESDAIISMTFFDFLTFNKYAQRSSEDWTVTLSPYFLWFEVDYELRVNLDGQTDSVSWNLDTLPITVPPPDPPLPEEPPEEPDEPFKPDDPFPELDPPPPNILPERIPTSIKDLIGFSKEEILASFAAGIPFYSDALYFAADLFDFIFENVLGIVVVALGFFFDPIYQMFNYLYDVVTWILTSVISFGQYFEIPNHILSRLVQTLPNSIVNFALVVFGFDILLNIVSVAVSDLITAYRSTVYTYYHKVEHSEPKGGKK